MLKNAQIRKNIIPWTDLNAQDAFADWLHLTDDVGLALVFPTLLAPVGPRILQGNNDGSLLVSSGSSGFPLLTELLDNTGTPISGANRLPVVSSNSQANAYTLQGSGTVTGNGSGVFNFITGTRQAVLIIACTAIAGAAPSVQFGLDGTSDSVNIITNLIPLQTAITATGVFAYHIGPGLAVAIAFPQQVRVKWVFGGTTTSITFSAILQTA